MHVCVECSAIVVGAHQTCETGAARSHPTRGVIQQQGRKQKMLSLFNCMHEPMCECVSVNINLQTVQRGADYPGGL